MRKTARPGFDLRCVWHLAGAGEAPEEAVLTDLLEGISASGSIGAAAERAGISYRNAWGLLRRWEERLGQPLVVMVQGRGSTLAALGEQILRLQREAEQRVAPILQETAQRMNQLLEKSPRRTRALSIQASHDLVLERLAEYLRATGQPVDLAFQGSLEALAAFAAGRCDIAGFHCARGEAASILWARYRPLLKDRYHRLVLLAEREQGIMVAAGNPKELHRIEDLARRDVRFINRQAGAGTRMLLDALLAPRAIAPDSIAGYAAVEFTHGAVAAMIASGQADAGLGIAAAAERFGLDFIPVTREHYLLAFRRAAAKSAGLEALFAALASRELRAATADLGGYNWEDAGRVLTPGEFAELLVARPAFSTTGKQP